MFDHGRTSSFVLVLAVAGLLAACSDSPTQVDDAATPEATAASMASTNSRAAVTDRQTFTVPFPPPPAEFVPVPAPCLALDEPLRMSGVWTGWYRTTTTANGREHTTEYIDYSGITMRLGDLRWLPGPGAHEVLVFNVPAPGFGADDVDGAFSIRHEFHARFLSQDGLPDLRVSHRVKMLLDATGVLRHDEFVPFEAECIGRRG